MGVRNPHTPGLNKDKVLRNFHYFLSCSEKINPDVGKNIHGSIKLPCLYSTKSPNRGFVRGSH